MTYDHAPQGMPQGMPQDTPRNDPPGRSPGSGSRSRDSQPIRLQGQQLASVLGIRATSLSSAARKRHFSRGYPVAEWAVWHPGGAQIMGYDVPFSVARELLPDPVWQRFVKTGELHLEQSPMDESHLEEPRLEGQQDGTSSTPNPGCASTSRREGQSPVPLGHNTLSQIDALKSILDDALQDSDIERATDTLGALLSIANKTVWAAVDAGMRLGYTEADVLDFIGKKDNSSGPPSGKRPSGKPPFGKPPSGEYPAGRPSSDDFSSAQAPPSLPQEGESLLHWILAPEIFMDDGKIFSSSPSGFMFDSPLTANIFWPISAPWKRSYTCELGPHINL